LWYDRFSLIHPGAFPIPLGDDELWVVCPIRERKGKEGEEFEEEEENEEEEEEKKEKEEEEDALPAGHNRKSKKSFRSNFTLYPSLSPPSPSSSPSLSASFFSTSSSPLSFLTSSLLTERILLLLMGFLLE
jgi:hypothetical protein